MMYTRIVTEVVALDVVESSTKFGSQLVSPSGKLYNVKIRQERRNMPQMPSGTFTIKALGKEERFNLNSKHLEELNSYNSYTEFAIKSLLWTNIKSGEVSIGDTVIYEYSPTNEAKASFSVVFVYAYHESMWQRLFAK